MMTGRLGESSLDAWPCWLSSASASGKAVCAPTPAATAPSTDDFTKSRRENVTSPPDRCSVATITLQAKREAYHGLVRCSLGGSDPRRKKKPQLRRTLRITKDFN